MRRMIAAVSLTTALALAVPASAATWIFDSSLDPEVAGASGTGSVRVTFDTDARTLQIDSDWSGLSAGTTVAHIHCCVAPPGTAGVAVTPPTLPGFPTGVTSGTYTTTLDLSDASTYSTSFLDTLGGGTTEGAQAALLEGLQSQTAYFNVHTTAFPGGEIRGFMTAVPEPATWGLMIIGFGAIGAALRRRSRGVADGTSGTFHSLA